MRRPIFGDGFPTLMNEGDTVTVFDSSVPPLSGLQDRLVGITLFAYVNDVTAGNGVNLDILNNGDQVTQFVAVNGIITEHRVYKVLDNFIVRGSTVLTVDWPAGPVSTDPCWLWGYFEMEGIDPLPSDIRPLQPATPPVSPFNAGVQICPVGATTLIHQLSDQFIDIFSMDMLITPGGTGSILTFGDDTANSVLVSGTDPDTAGAVKLFDGIPMRPLPNTNVDVNVVVGGGEAGPSSVFGQFKRA